PHGPQSRHRRSHQDQGFQEGRVPRLQGVEGVDLTIGPFPEMKKGRRFASGLFFWVDEPLRPSLARGAETRRIISLRGRRYAAGQLRAPPLPTCFAREGEAGLCLSEWSPGGMPGSCPI